MHANKVFSSELFSISVCTVLEVSFFFKKIIILYYLVNKIVTPALPSPVLLEERPSVSK